MSSSLRALAVLTALGLAAPGHATTLTFEFTGQVTAFVDGLGLLDGSVGAGTPVTGSYTFDPDAPDQVPDVENFGTYVTPVPPGGIALQAGNARFVPHSAHPLLIQMANDVEFPFRSALRDGHVVIGVDRLAAGDPSRDWVVALQIFDVGPSGAPADAIDSDALLRTPPNPDDWDTVGFLVTTDVPSFAFFMGGVVDSFRVAPPAAVPEPASWLAFGVGALLVAARTSTRRADRRAPAR
jgi:hypothetical protein